MENVKECFQMLKEFENYSDNWDGEGGMQLDHDCIKAARLFCKNVYKFFGSFYEIDSFPNSNGGVNLSISSEDDFIELYFMKTNKGILIDFSHEKGFGPNYKIIKRLDGIDQINAHRYLWKFRIGELSGLLFTSLSEESLLKMPSKFTEMGYPLFASNAQWNNTGLPTMARKIDYAPEGFAAT